MIPVFFPYLVIKHITIYLDKSLNNLFTVCYSHEYFFSLVLKEILTLHCWIWWEDNSFQIPEGGFIVRYCLLKMLFAGTQNVEAERANNLWLSWITFCTDGTFCTHAVQYISQYVQPTGMPVWGRKQGK